MPVPTASPVLVLGAGPGLGLQIERRFGRAEHPVVLAARGADRLDDHVAALRGEGVTALAVPADLRDPDHRRNVVVTAEREFGALGVVHHGRGAADPTARATPLAQAGPDEVRALVDAIVLPTVDIAALVLPGMIEHGAGALLLVTGLSAVHPLPIVGAGDRPRDRVRRPDCRCRPLTWLRAARRVPPQARRGPHPGAGS